MAWSFVGMTILPHMRQPPSNPSSVSRDLNGFSSGGTSAGHPAWMYVTTLLSTGSRRVSRWMSVAVTGSVSMRRTGKAFVSEEGSTLLKMVCYCSTTVCYYWDMSVK